MIYNEKLNDLIAAITANTYFLLIIMLFIARIFNKKDTARALGMFSCLAIIPLIYLLISSFYLKRDVIYFVWIILIILFVLFEIVFDYALSVEFRKKHWQTVVYVMFFCGATGGMIGIASKAGRTWSILTILIYIVMIMLAFIQKKITGI